MKFLIFTAILTCSLSSLYAEVPPQSCKQAVHQIAAEYRMEDLQWLCGESSNTPVPGYGTNPTYLSCLTKLLYTGVRDGSILTQKCKFEADTRTSSYCVSTVHQIAPEYRMGDLTWLCGESSNSPVPGYGTNHVYQSCLINSLYSGIRDGNILTQKCKLEADAAVSSYCVSMAHQIEPLFKMGDLTWLCGESSNSPVPGYGNNQIYTKCLIAKLYSGIRDGNVLTGQCKLEVDAQNSRCTSMAHQIVPEFRLTDLQWLCGESSNTPVPGYGQNGIYFDCLRRLLQTGIRDGSVLTRQCKLEADIH